MKIFYFEEAYGGVFYYDPKSRQGVILREKEPVEPCEVTLTDFSGAEKISIEETVFKSIMLAGINKRTSDVERMLEEYNPQR